MKQLENLTAAAVEFCIEDEIKRWYAELYPALDLVDANQALQLICHELWAVRSTLDSKPAKPDFGFTAEELAEMKARCDAATPGLEMSVSCGIISVWNPRYVQSVESCDPTEEMQSAAIAKRRTPSDGGPTTPKVRSFIESNGENAESSQTPATRPVENASREETIQITTESNGDNESNGYGWVTLPLRNLEHWLSHLDQNASIAGVLSGADAHRATRGDLTMLFHALVEGHTESKTSLFVVVPAIQLSQVLKRARTDLPRLIAALEKLVKP